MSTVLQETQELFRTCQKRLGGTARLGFYAVLFDPDGEKRADIGFNEHEHSNGQCCQSSNSHVDRSGNRKWRFVTP